MKGKKLYKDYFQIDENYFPCVNESAIKAGLKWDDFYPHDTFIDLLSEAERMLSRQSKRSLWISGAYGTGKSYAAFTLTSLLTASNLEVEAYFDKYEALSKHRTDLMQRLLTIKNKGRILTCYRYASATINDTNDLITVVQELVAKSVKDADCEYKGENTLRRGILNWLEDGRNKDYFASYVEKEYRNLFGGWSADEIIDKLRKTEASTALVGKISKMAGEMGVSALKMDMDGLIAYIRDIISVNKLQGIVFVLDEFSEFFQNNRGRLSDFQKLVEICVETPFFLVVVAHQMGSYFHEKDTDAKKIKDRFMSCEITMPDNIAFDLLKDAMRINPDAEEEWKSRLDDLQAFTKKSRYAVSKYTRIEKDVLKGVLPLHPMTALLLKHISSAFESNQRSMFDFIKDDGNYKAFQWFISEYGPLDETSPLFTVDMLWDFFYETGGDNLAQTIRNILDTYKRAERQGLQSEEQQVLKTILTMQAVSVHLNDAIPLFITNGENLDLCFEGTDYEMTAQGKADNLVAKDILYKRPLGQGNFCYATAVMPGDAAELDKKKSVIISRLQTKELISDETKRVLRLTEPLKMRCVTEFAAHDEIMMYANRFANKEADSSFRVIVGLAKDENEAVHVRKMMKENIKSVAQEDKNIVFIDTTPTPFGTDSIAQYAEYMAGSEIQRGRDNAASADMLLKSKKVASDWANKIYNGQIIIYSKSKPEGKRYDNWEQALNGLCDLVTERYLHALEYESGLSEVTLKTGSQQQWVEAGLVEKSGGQTASAEKIVRSARKDDKYWINDPYSALGSMKNALDKKINNDLTAHSRIAITDVIRFLRDEFGFVHSHLYSFITGFLLKEYANEAYRLSDEANNEKMSVEKMKEIVDEGFKQLYNPKSRYREKYIRIMSHEEQLFCDLMSELFDIPESQCGSVEDVLKRVRVKAKSFGLPFWILEEAASGVELDFIGDFVKALNTEQGTSLSTVGGKIGRLVESDEKLASRLKTLTRPENFDSALLNYLEVFEGGRLLNLAEEIHMSRNDLISDVKRRFGDDTEGLWLWSRETGEEQIRKVIGDYEFVRVSNKFLAKDDRSVAAAISSWQSKLKFINVSYEIVKKNRDYEAFVPVLYNVARNQIHAGVKELHDALIKHGDGISDFLTNARGLFAKALALQLKGLSESEINEVYAKITDNCFVMNKSDYITTIEKTVGDFKSNLARMKLRDLWKEKTGTDDPLHWSDHYGTPILACLPNDKWDDYKRAIDAAKDLNPKDSEVEFALGFLTANPIWGDLVDSGKINKAFEKGILGAYKAVLTDLDAVRRYLKKHAANISAYDWRGHSEINRLVKELAWSEYSKEPFEKVVRLIDRMDGDKLKEYLKLLVEENMTVGIEILEDSGAG